MAALPMRLALLPPLAARCRLPSAQAVAWLHLDRSVLPAHPARPATLCGR
jgi:hypothetical protein